MAENKHNFDTKLDMPKYNGAKWAQYPEDVLPLWIADSDFLSPAPIVEALEKRAKEGVYSYPIIPDSFYNAVIQWTNTRYNFKVEKEAICFCHTLVTALSDITYAFTNEEDKIIIMTPVYPPFHHIIEDLNRVKVCSALKEIDGKWHIDFEDFESKIADKAVKVFFLCSPHNPTGKVFTHEELERIHTLCIRHNVLVVSDEIHADIIYKPNKFITFPNICEDAKNNSIVLLSTSKTFNTPGLRVAVAIAHNKDIRMRFEESMKKNKTAEPNIFGLVALEAAYTQCAYFADELVLYLEKNRDYVIETINNEISDIKIHKNEGTFLLWLDCRALGFKKQEELMSFMLEKAKVALNNGEDFGKEGIGYVRLNISCPRATLEEALKRIKNAVNAR